MARPLRSHFPGFDGLRLVAAVAVIFSHAFLIATGSEEAEPFVRLLGPGNILGLYGVFTFFVISGFLLARSLDSTTSSPVTYAVNRTLRILPGFVFCIVVTALVVGPVCSSLPRSEYLTSPDVREYVVGSLQTLGDWRLPGVFAYHGDADLVVTVNGSLWSLRYEALSYVFLLVLWMVFRGSGAVAVVAGTIAGLTWTFPAVDGYLTSISYTLPYFASGIVMHWIYRTYGTSVLAAVCSLGCLVLSAVIGIQGYAFAIFGAYLIVFAGERPNVGSTLAQKIGDCSYGLYLYGWPAEQAIKQLTHTTSPLVLFMLATPLAFVFAAISCHLVERPAMRLRTAATRRINALFDLFGAARRAAAVGGSVSFVAVATTILLAKVHWWYFAQSMGELIVAVVAAAIACAVLHYTVIIRPRRARSVDLSSQTATAVNAGTDS